MVFNSHCITMTLIIIANNLYTWLNDQKVNSQSKEMHSFSSNGRIQITLCNFSNLMGSLSIFSVLLSFFLTAIFYNTTLLIAFDALEKVKMTIPPADASQGLSRHYFKPEVITSFLTLLYIKCFTNFHTKSHNSPNSIRVKKTAKWLPSRQEEKIIVRL